MSDSRSYVRISTTDGPVFAREQNDSYICLSAPPWDSSARPTTELPADESALLAPVCPSKVICLGVNYIEHAQEMSRQLPEDPLIFMKPPSAIIGPGAPILYPPYWTERVDYEAELAVVIGKKAWRVKEEDVNEYIFGYTCLNDVTARDLQKKDLQWIRAKSFDSFCPIGPRVVTNIDPTDLYIRSWLNDDIRQDSRTSCLIFSVARIVSFVSHIMTLLPGDVIATGTPEGIGPMQPGDTVRIEVEHIGALTNPVKNG